MNKFWVQAQELKSEIVKNRRDIHQHAESAWTEYRTASLVATELTKLGYDVYCGAEVIDEASMMGVPDAKTLELFEKRALTEGADVAWVEKMRGGKTGVMGVMKFAKPGNTVAMRFDMDANDVAETKEVDHIPNIEGFASIHANVMHACGHDGHTSIGLAVAKLIMMNKEEMSGTIKMIFQPAEEGVRGAKAMVAKGIVDDVDYFFGAHLGFNANKNKQVVCMTDEFLATTKLDAYFKGVSAHAGAAPEQGCNALLAAAQASISLHSISRHGKGVSRINVGVIDAGTGRNVLPDVGVIKLETRGGNTEINDFMMNEAVRMIKGAALTYNVEVTIKEMGGAPSCSLDKEIGEEIHQLLEKTGKYDEVTKVINLGASEDCTYFMERVQQRGGKAIYMMLGSDLKAGHHNYRFDFDEQVLVEGSATMAYLAKTYLAK